jgi:hypothetical protein|tara:strand:- start:2598 stop:3773 length:1176 start_codon:yes stop_codon:yes gene_type:complete
MSDRIFHIKISPENINDIYGVKYSDGFMTGSTIDDECCDIEPIPDITPITGESYVYSSMTQILSGGTEGASLLTGLTIPILITETTNDIGYYSVFDGAVTQKDVISNFLFSATTTSPYQVYFYNTSDTEFKKYLSFSNYIVDWGDGSPQQTITNMTPINYVHSYSSPGVYNIVLSGASPWGYNVVKKDVTVPYTNVVANNPNGTAYFLPRGGSWSGVPLMYDYIFHGDENCDSGPPISGFTTTPFIVSGYTESTINDLQVYGNKALLLGGKFKLGVNVSGDNGVEGVVHGPSTDGLYTAYTINDVNYYDYSDGTTVFVVESSGITEDMVICSGLTKNEVLMGVIDEAEIQSNVFIERGKMSALESMNRLGEVDNVGDLEKYGYKFFNVIKT